jgi:hypothetical protein
MACPTRPDPPVTRIVKPAQQLSSSGAEEEEDMMMDGDDIMEWV